MNKTDTGNHRFDISAYPSLCRYILNFVSDHIIVLDRQRTIIAANGTFISLPDIADPVGRDLFEISDHVFNVEPLTSLLKTPVTEDIDVRDTEICVSFPDTGQKTFIITVVAISEPSNILISFRDITKEKIMREKMLHSEKLAAIGNIVGSISHDLRNPLGIIGNAVYYLAHRLSDTVDHRIKKHIAIIRNEIERTDSFLEDLLNLSISPEIQIEQHDIHVLIRRIVEGIRTSADIRISTDFTNDNSCIPVNRHEIHRSLVNIISNAVDAVGKIGTINITTRNVHSYFTIEIFNDGPPIPTKQLENIFEPFFTTKHDGTGMGLAISKNIIERHNGTIVVSSSRNSGTVFTIALPITIDRKDGV